MISSPENIHKAINKIRCSKFSTVAGVDGVTFAKFESMHSIDAIEYIQKILANYQPRPVKRIYITKQSRNQLIGLACIIDRIIHQCFLQVLVDICDSNFNLESYGFRKIRRASHAIARFSALINKSQTFHTISIDLKQILDNANHKLLLKQCWKLGVKDKTVIAMIKKILKAGYVENGKVVSTSSGLIQCGSLSTLFMNIILDKLDWFVTRQWELTKTKHTYCNSSKKYRALRSSNRLEQYYVRYNTEVIILCKSFKQSKIIFSIVKKFLLQQLHLSLNDSVFTDLQILARKPKDKSLG